MPALDLRRGTFALEFCPMSTSEDSVFRDHILCVFFIVKSVIPANFLFSTERGKDPIVVACYTDMALQNRLG